MSDEGYRKVKPLLHQLDSIGKSDSSTKLKLLSTGVMRANNNNDINALMITGKKKIKPYNKKTTKKKFKREQDLNSGVDPDTIDVDDRELPKSDEREAVEVNIEKKKKPKTNAQGFQDIDIEYSRGRGTGKTFEIRDKRESEGTFEISDKGHVIREGTDISRSTKKYKEPLGIKAKRVIKQGAKKVAHEIGEEVSAAYGYRPRKRGPTRIQRGVSGVRKSYERSRVGYKKFRDDLGGFRTSEEFSTKSLGIAVGKSSRRVRRKRKYVDISDTGGSYDMSGIGS